MIYRPFCRSNIIVATRKGVGVTFILDPSRGGPHERNVWVARRPMRGLSELRQPSRPVPHGQSDSKIRTSEPDARVRPLVADTGFTPEPP